MVVSSLAQVTDARGSCAELNLCLSTGVSCLDWLKHQHSENLGVNSTMRPRSARTVWTWTASKVRPRQNRVCRPFTPITQSIAFTLGSQVCKSCDKRKKAVKKQMKPQGRKCALDFVSLIRAFCLF